MKPMLDLEHDLKDKLTIGRCRVRLKRSRIHLVAPGAASFKPA